jgi:RNA polymerase sigma-70 factor (ECF subfamily)
VDATTDADLLAEAFRAHHRDLVGYARRRLGNAELAEEAAQETFVRAWRSIHRFDPAAGNARMWLFGICRNAAVDVGRRWARAGRAEPCVSAAELFDDGGLDEVTARCQAERALERLTPSQRDAVIDVHLRERSYAEVAARHGVPVGTIKSRVHIGLRAARQSLVA